MKIGFVLDDGLDSNDGVQQYVRTLGSWLESEGHEVHYIVGHTTRTDIANVHSLARNIRVRFNKNRVAIPLYASKKKIRQLLRAESFDVLHVQMPYSPLFAGTLIASAPDTTAIVGTFHILPFGNFQKIGAQLLTRISRRTLRKIDSVFAVSKAAQQFAQNTLGIPCRVIPNAVDLKLFNSGTPLAKYTNTQVVLFLGRLVERKGCIELVHAVHTLIQQNKFSGKKLVICGSGPLSHSIESYIQMHNLRRYITMVGQIKEAEKPHYLASADVAVFPSKGGESFGIVLVEAIASGAGVVLGGDNAGYRFVLGNDNRTLVNPAEREAFATKLDYVLTHQKEARHIQTVQQKRITQFDIQVVGAEILQEYTRLIANHQKSSDNTTHE